MTQHLHTERVPGCYRCELNQDELDDDVFMLVTAAREESWISVVIEPHEWEKLQPLAFALRDQDATWTAQPHAGQSHRSQSVVPSDAPAETESGGVGTTPLGIDEHSGDPASPHTS